MTVVKFPRPPVRDLKPDSKAPTWQDVALVAACFVLVVVAQWVLL
jgi:hypothetical protein